MARTFLRKQGTYEVFAWTEILAARTDMRAISEKEAKICWELIAKQQKARIAAKTLDRESVLQKAAAEDLASAEEQVDIAAEILAEAGGEVPPEAPAVADAPPIVEDLVLAPAPELAPLPPQAPTPKKSKSKK